MAVVLVTGCSSGFGEAAAFRLAEIGHQVFATLRRPEAATPRLRDHSNVRLHALDVTDPAARDRSLEAVVAQFGRLDVLINNAGVAFSASIEDSSEARTRALFETNFFGPLALMRSALTLMRAQGGGGRIVNVTAIGAIFATPLLGIYCASKHALDGATGAMDIEARPFGVRVVSVLPGPFKTAIAEKSPPPEITDGYVAIAEAMGRARAARPEDLLSDLTPVVDAVVAAAFDDDPKPRYLVGRGLTTELQHSLVEFERLQRFDLVRAGLGAG